MRGTQLATVALVGLLVLSPVGSMLLAGSLSGPATAQTEDPNFPDECDFDRTTGEFDCGEFVNTTNADKLDAYNDALVMESHIGTSRVMLENSISDAENRAWLKAEMAFFESYMDGESLTVARQRGVEAMRNHYAVRQTNLIETVSNGVNDLVRIQTSAKNLPNPLPDTALGGLYVENPTSEAMSPWAEKSYLAIYLHDTPPANISDDAAVYRDLRTAKTQMELADGSLKDILNFRFKTAQATISNGNYTFVANHYSTGTSLRYYGENQVNILNKSSWAALSPINTQDPLQYGDDWTYQGVHARYVPTEYPDAAMKSRPIMDFADWNDLWGRYNSSLYEEIPAFETFANKSYEAAERGKIDPSEILSRLNQMNEYALDLRSDVEGMTFNDGVIALNAMGLSAPGNATAYMNVTYQTEFGGQRYRTEGLLMSHSNPPSGVWEVGRTYNTTNIDGSQLVVHFDGNRSTIRGEFTIHKVYDTDGNVIDDPMMKSPNVTYKVSNDTELRDQIQELADQIAKWRNITSTPGAGGGGGFSWPSIGIPNPFGALGAFGQWLILAGIILLVMAFVAVMS